MMDQNQFSTWSTGDEIAYLNTIGTHSSLTNPFTKRELLEGYAAALKYRPRCTYLDFTKLQERVYELLNEGSATH